MELVCYDCECIIENESDAITIGGETFCRDCADDWTVCDDCGSAVKVCNAYETHNGYTICESCYEDFYFTCEDCGRVFRSDDVVAIDRDTRRETWVCEDCARDNYYRCRDCGNYVSDHGRAYYIDNETCICDNCADEWRECEECGDVIRLEDAYYVSCENAYYCEDCHNEHSHGAYVHDYGYKPAPVFYRTENNDTLTRVYGIELEIDDGNDVDDFISDVGDVDELYYKHDGSLDDGVEIVSHPCTLEYHETCAPWDAVFDAARENGFKSHDAGTCGLHIHVGRENCPDDAPEKLIALCDAADVWGGLVKFSRRSESQLNHWAAKPDGGFSANDDGRTVYDKLLKVRGKGRYQAINLQNRATIEFRMIRGTLRRVSFFAALELFDGMLEYCAAHTLAECTETTWDKLKSSINGENFKIYVAERGI